jgi:hypothetical protein
MSFLQGKARTKASKYNVYPLRSFLSPWKFIAEILVDLI